MKKVLFLCTGNSCRSIMAEAILKHLAGDRYKAYSAGSKPSGYIHQGSIETLKRHDVPIGNPSSKSWDVFKDQRFDIIVTVCDNAAGEICPVFLGEQENPPLKIHWSITDPAHVEGGGARAQPVFEEAFNALTKNIEALIAEQI